jgi:hypothetical protein
VTLTSCTAPTIGAAYSQCMPFLYRVSMRGWAFIAAPHLDSGRLGLCMATHGV